MVESPTVIIDHPTEDREDVLFVRSDSPVLGCWLGLIAQCIDIRPARLFMRDIRWSEQCFGAAKLLVHKVTKTARLVVTSETGHICANHKSSVMSLHHLSIVLMPQCSYQRRTAAAETRVRKELVVQSNRQRWPSERFCHPFHQPNWRVFGYASRKSTCSFKFLDRCNLVPNGI